MDLGPFAGPIFATILVVECLFFLFLEWWIPREDLDYVPSEWDISAYTHASAGLLSLLHMFTY
jgi:phosphatidylinositol glycan class A protein